MLIQNSSKLLLKAGIEHALGGSQFNFKQTNEVIYKDSVTRLLQSLPEQPKQLFHAQQVHGKVVAKVGSDNVEKFKQFADFPIVEQTDGLMTNEPGTALLIRMADCTPIVLFDPRNNAIAIVHSGWKSTVLKISQVAIAQMNEHYGSKVEDLIVYVGPSIDSEHYEVGSEVYEAFAEIGNRERYFGAKGEKYTLNMVQANIEILLQAGVQLANIEYSTESTFTSERLHSARQEGMDYQLNGLMVYLPEK